MHKSYLSEVKQEMIRAAQDFVTIATQRVQDDARTNVRSSGRVDTGRLMQSIERHQEATDSGVLGVVGTNLEYAIFNERGTGIYALDGGRQTPWVYPIAGKFDDSGRQLFARTQGMEPIQFLERAGTKNEPFIYQTLIHVMGAVGS